MSRMTFSAAAARAAALAGEDDDDLDEEPGEVIESAPPLEVGEEREILRSGIRKKLLKSGRGWETPVTGDEVAVRYVGRLVDGTEFESSKDKDEEPITLKLGSGQIVVGLDQAIATMRKGERALFTIPPALGYGNVGRGSVPPNSTLCFEVELVSWISVVNVTQDGGIVKRIIVRGDGGKPSDLDQVTVKYDVKLPDGEVADKIPGIEFYINDGHFCPALPKVIGTMEKGEKADVIVQPQYAFGELGKGGSDGFPSIPPNTPLSIELELVSFKRVVDITGDKKVLKKIIREGKGITKPEEGEVVRVRYVGMLEDGTIFEKLGFDGDQGFQFVIGEEHVIAGLDQAAPTMAKGELSLLTVKPECGYGENEVKRDLAIIPPCATLALEVEMLDFIKNKEPHEMDFGEKLEFAGKLKESGNFLFKNGKYPRAAKKYEKAIEYVNDDESYKSEELQKVWSLRISCWLNSAACCLKLNDFPNAIKSCSKVLEVEFLNVKALYRRAQAFLETYDLDMAELDIKKALQIDSKNREVLSIQRKLKELQAERRKRDAKLYGNMFAPTKEDADALKRLKVETTSDMEQDVDDQTFNKQSDLVDSKDSSVEAIVVDPSLLKRTT